MARCSLCGWLHKIPRTGAATRPSSTLANFRSRGSSAAAALQSDGDRCPDAAHSAYAGAHRQAAAKFGARRNQDADLIQNALEKGRLK
jgi:hypothetical protein